MSKCPSYFIFFSLSRLACQRSAFNFTSAGSNLLVYESISPASAFQLIFLLLLGNEMRTENTSILLLFPFVLFVFFFSSEPIIIECCSNDINNNCHLKKRFVQIRTFSAMSVYYLLLLFPRINTLCMFVGFNNNFFCSKPTEWLRPV